MSNLGRVDNLNTGGRSEKRICEKRRCEKRTEEKRKGEERR